MLEGSGHYPQLAKYRYIMLYLYLVFG